MRVAFTCNGVTFTGATVLLLGYFFLENKASLQLI